MNLSHPLNKANDEACASTSDPFACHCDKLVDACKWIPRDVDTAKCASDSASCALKCDADVKAKVDEIEVPKGEDSSSYLNRLLDRVKRRAIRFTDKDYTRESMQAQDNYHSCKRVCEMDKRSCEIGDIYGTASRGAWEPEGCMDAAAELSNPDKNGGRIIRSFDDHCAPRIGPESAGRCALGDAIWDFEEGVQ